MLLYLARLTQIVSDVQELDDRGADSDSEEEEDDEEDEVKLYF